MQNATLSYVPSSKEEKTESGTVLYLGLDHDGCLSAQRAIEKNGSVPLYYQTDVEKAKKDIADNNTQLVEFISTLVDQHKPKKIILGSFSNRQNYIINRLNSLTKDGQTVMKDCSVNTLVQLRIIFNNSLQILNSW